MSLKRSESSEECTTGQAEPPDPDILEIDPTCRYVRVMHLFSLSSIH